VFERVTAFRQEHSDRPEDSYFEVTLQGVSSFRNQIFDIEKVRRYLGQIAPVPFDYQQFSYARTIDDFLSSRLKGYGRYNIILNGEPVLKPYGDVVRITKGDGDRLEGVEFFEIKNGKDQPFAYGWYGRRKELLGSIVKGDDSSGIRIRVGNIQIGDAHLLDFCFREPRFNGYVPGEVHVVSNKLIPNSRRDDFVDNREKGLFYNSIEREVGLPISKEIRARSRLASAPQISSPAPRKDSSAPHNGGGQCLVPQSLCALSASQESRLRQNAGAPLAGTNEPLDPPSTALPPCYEASSHSLRDMLQNVCEQCPNIAKLLDLLGRQ
jgi:molecular chaperone HtpG